MIKIKLPDGTEVTFSNEEEGTAPSTVVPASNDTLHVPLPYDTVKIAKWTDTTTKMKIISFYKGEQPVYLYKGLHEIKTSWIRTFVNPSIVNDVAVFKNVLVTIEPETPYLTNNELIADKVYIKPRA